MYPNALPFAGLEEPVDYESASAVVLPVPFERTTSYGRGTAAGPDALLRASAYLELYDEELDLEPWESGLFTAPSVEPTSEDMEEALGEITREVARHLRAGKLVVTVGGEHSLTYGPVRAAAERFPGLGVVQFDAHADLRDEYEGSRHSHACIMHRVLDLDLRSLAVGIRSLSTPEARLIRERELPVIWGHELDRARELFAAKLHDLPEEIYLTFDVDFFDPAFVPCTGTPEPGGGSWYPTLELLRLLFQQKRVVAMDIVELSPRPGQAASDFLAAKLLYKCLAYKTLGR